MARVKDQVLISVISGLDKNQSATLRTSQMILKNIIAPGARGTIAQSSVFEVGKTLSGGIKKLTGGK